MLFSEYLEHSRGVSTLTIKNYCSDVKAAGLLESVYDCFKYICKAKTESTKARRYYSMKAYIRWATKYGKIQVEQTLDEYIERAPKPKAGVPKPIDDQTYDKFKRAIKLIPLQERTILMLLMQTGRRVSEILALTMEDLLPDPSGLILVIEGKGGIKSHKFLDQDTEAYKTLQTYLQEIKEGKLFYVNSSDAYQSFYHCYSKLCLPFNIHRIRHTVGTRILDATGSIETVAEALGHLNLNTSRRYAKVNQLAHRELMRGVKL